MRRKLSGLAGYHGLLEAVLLVDNFEPTSSTAYTRSRWSNLSPPLPTSPHFTDSRWTLEYAAASTTTEVPPGMDTGPIERNVERRRTPPCLSV